MLEKIKANWSLISGMLLALLAGAFLFEKSKRDSADSIADNKADLDKLNEMNRVVSSNNGQLDAEEAKRKALKKEADDAKSNGDDSGFLDKR